MVKKIKNWILVQQIFAFKFYIPKNPDARAINSNLKPRFERMGVLCSRLNCVLASLIAPSVVKEEPGVRSSRASDRLGVIPYAADVD